MKKLIMMLLGSLWIASPCVAGTLLDLNILGGIKQLSSSDWGDNDTHGAVGFEAVGTPPLFPVSFVGGYLRTADTNDHTISFSGGSEQLKAETEEMWLGIGKKFDLPLIHFLVSGGPAFIRARQDAASTLSSPVTTDRDDGWGYYVSGSTFLHLIGLLNIGAEVRYSSAKVTLGSREVKAGGISYLGLLGIGF